MSTPRVIPHKKKKTNKIYVLLCFDFFICVTHCGCYQDRAELCVNSSLYRGNRWCCGSGLISPAIRCQVYHRHLRRQV